MKIIQAIIIALFILVIPILFYFWLLSWSYGFGQLAMVVSALLLLGLLFYPLRKPVKAQQLSVGHYFSALGQDLWCMGRCLGCAGCSFIKTARGLFRMARQGDQAGRDTAASAERSHEQQQSDHQE